MQSGVPLTDEQREFLRERITNQTQLAAELGVSHVTMARWLSGARAPSEEMLRRLCTSLGMEVEVRTVVRFLSRRSRSKASTPSSK